MLWIGLILIFCFAVALSYGVFDSRIKKLDMSLTRIREAGWSRLAKLPLLVSLAVADGVPMASFTALIKQKELLNNDQLSLGERIVAEKQLTVLFEQTFVSLGAVAKNPQLVAVKRELGAELEEFNRAINQYNFIFDGLIAMKRLPWFAVWGILVKKDKSERLQNV